MAACNALVFEAFWHAISRYDNVDSIENVPAMVWQKVGDDAILMGYNDALVEWTHGGIHNALGVAASEFLGPESFARLQRCFATGSASVYDCIRPLQTYPGEMWRMLTMVCQRGEDRVVVHSFPLEMVAERVYQME